jgi:hypothetical protein
MWSKIRAQATGWFFSRDGQFAWCPAHNPPWVTAWREKQAAKTPPPPSCAHCAGYRCPCTCMTDCSARPGPESAHCPQADDYRDYLRGTGLYPELEQGQ